MIFQKQLFRHDPSRGEWGDCYRTAIACLLGLPAKHVPHFYYRYHENQHTAVNESIDNWLADKGYATARVMYQCDLETLFNVQKALNPDIYYMLTGESKNGVNHVVICLNDQIVWDSSLDDSGIIGPSDDGHYWIEWLLPVAMKLQAAAS